jgi:hypothetical protein
MTSFVASEKVWRVAKPCAHGALVAPLADVRTAANECPFLVNRKQLKPVATTDDPSPTSPFRHPGQEHALAEAFARS